MKLPDPIQKVADALAELPSIGPRQAIRMAFYLVGRSKQDTQNLAASIDNLRNIKTCERCFFIHQNENDAATGQSLCNICGNPNRNQRVVMVIEKETDLVSLENTGKFTGRYFIIGTIMKTGALEEWQKLRLQSLKSFIEKNPAIANGNSTMPTPTPDPAPTKGQADEIIFAFNPTSLGNLQAAILTKELAPFTKKISRLGRGLPTGGEIEFADDETLGSALERRS